MNRRSLAWGGLWCLFFPPAAEWASNHPKSSLLGFRTSPKFHPAAWIHRFEPLWAPGPPNAVGELERAVGASGSLWGPLGAFGSLWAPSAASESLRKPLGAFGGLWGPSEASGSFREPLGAFREPSGNLWEPLEPLGSFWEPLGAFGSLRKPYGASGSLWEPLGASGSLRESIYVAFKPRFNIARCEAVDTRLRVFINLSKIIGSEHPGLLKLHGYAGHGPIVVHSPT